MSNGAVPARGDGPLILVLGDSLAFHGPDRPEPADEPRLWPNVAAAVLGGRAELVARSGWTARHVWAALADDPRIWALLPRIDALVLGTGGMDSLPSPLPTAVRELLPALRPEPLRRAVRRGYLRAQPGLSRAFAAALPGGGPATLPARLSVAHLERCRAAVHALRPGLPVLALLPSVHRAGAYGGAHPHRGAAERATREWAQTHGVGLLDVAALVSEHVLGGHGNPDGMHWGWDAHRRVGQALGEALRPALAARR